ncbi:MAG: class I tRNA ligase family protein, partial [Bacteroidota bacterium]
MELQGNPEGWRAYWESEDSRLVHFIGKDNIVFHTLIFPMMLAAHGQMVLPWQVPANEFMNLEGRKLSTSRGWAVWLHEYLQDIPGRQDELRYTLLCNLPETKDADFSWQDYQLRVNSELVAILGNFVNRVMVLTHKLSDGHCGDLPTVEANTSHLSLELELAGTRQEILLAMEQFRLREAMSGVIHLARLGNRYLAETEPWKLLKTDSEAASQVLRLAAELCAELCIALEPFLPFTASKLSNQLQWQASAQEREAWWNPRPTDTKGSTDARPRYLAQGHRLGAAALLFVPIEDELIQAQVHKLSPMNDPKPENKSKPENTPHPVAELKPEVTYDQFAALDLRIATILSAQPVPGADK